MKSSRIFKIKARQIIDSRGQPTLEVDLWLETGALGRASVPAGASRGRHEAVELRDGGTAFGGRGVLRASRAVTEMIWPRLERGEFDQASLDRLLLTLDGTKNKYRLGGNSLLAVSLAFARAVANERCMPLWQYFSSIAGDLRSPKLPTPLFNVFNGGAHALGAVDFQEYLIIPKGLPTINTRLQAGAEIYQEIANILRAQNKLTLVGDEGGFGAIFDNNEIPLEIMMKAIEVAGYEPGREIFLGLDVAASQFVKGDKYILRSGQRIKSREEMIEWYGQLIEKYPIILIEDPLSEDDWDGFRLLTSRFGHQIMVVGDDLFTTNPELVRHGIKNQTANAVLVKPNQIGTITETLETVKLAYRAGWEVVISHRSGETEDTAIAHLAVGLGAKFIKSGALARGERTGKYNELLRISEEVVG